MKTRWRQTGITMMVVAGLVGQLLVWAVHSHAHAVPAFVPLQCRTILHAVGKVPCKHNNHQTACAVCWSLATASTTIPTPPPLLPRAPELIAERLHAPTVQRFLPARLVAAYRSRAPPAVVAI